MTLHPPFFISARLLPAIRVGDAVLQIETISVADTHDGRDRAHMILDFPDGSFYEDTSLTSGCQGFRSSVEVFETFLSFLSACAESMSYSGAAGENSDLFPHHIAEWAEENSDDIQMAAIDLTEPDGNGAVLHHLIED